MNSRMWRVALAAALALALASGASHAQDAKALGETVTKTVETHRQTQKKQDDWANEQADMTARYRAARAQVDYLQKRKDFEEKEVRALDEGIAEMNRRLIESVRLQDNLEDSLNAVIGRLDQWVARDIPFLKEERSNRLAAVRAEVAKPDVTGAEKLRRVLEALQVEANYGNTVDVFQERIVVGDEEIFADILKIGRVSVYWRTPDGTRVGEYDRGQQKWVALDPKYVAVINDTREMALRLRSTEVVSLPLGRIQP